LPTASRFRRDGALFFGQDPAFGGTFQKIQVRQIVARRFRRMLFVNAAEGDELKISQMIFQAFFIHHRPRF
jgi:hypothetical protein